MAAATGRSDVMRARRSLEFVYKIERRERVRRRKFRRRLGVVPHRVTDRQRQRAEYSDLQAEVVLNECIVGSGFDEQVVQDLRRLR